MSSSLRPLQHASRTLKRRLNAPANSGSVSAFAGARRRYAAAAFARAPVVEEVHEEETRTRPYADEGFTTKYQRATPPAEAGARLATHLNETFKPLQFPPELAARMLTHVSHRDAVNGHNGRLAFLGRRITESYLLFWLHSLPPDLSERYDHDRTCARVLNTYTLGELVAPKWGISSRMRWSSPQVEVKEGEEPSNAAQVGLYKVGGMGVEAVMGGIYHQFGGSIAHRVFQTRLLPHLIQPKRPMGLPDTLVDAARESIQRMGGPQGPLIPSPMYTR
ncbi:unnamed protein product [Peniophora sp. CBMAI 1063]|nr:unnamed protein product [Peniophora sp. CBMAI 1063]